MLHQQRSWPLVALIVVVIVVIGSSGAAAQPGPSPEEADAVLEDLGTLATSYNEALGGGGDPPLADERVTLIVTGVGASDASAAYRFDVRADGRFADIERGDHPDATLELTTSTGTVGYLAGHDDPVAAFGAVFLRLDAASLTSDPTVQRAAEGHLEHTDDWVGTQLLIVVTGDATADDTTRVLDLRDGDPRLIEISADGAGRERTVPIDPLDMDDDGDGLDDLTLLRINDDGSTVGIEKITLAVENVIQELGGGGDCDDGDPPVHPDGTWLRMTCDGGPLLDADGSVYISVEEEGVKRTVRKDDDATERRGDPRGSSDDSNVVAFRYLTDTGDVERLRTGDDGGIDMTHPILIEVAVADDDGSVRVYVERGEPERIEPIQVQGVGIVNGVKWYLVDLLVGLGLF